MVSSNSMMDARSHRDAGHALRVSPFLQRQFRPALFFALQPSASSSPTRSTSPGLGRVDILER
jgi:hypothetical protein